jgi:hypothetical protein
VPPPLLPARDPRHRYFPSDATLNARITRFVQAWTQGKSDIVKFTPKGLAYSGPWGSLRHVGNAMFLMKAWAVGAPNANPAIKQAIDCTVRRQLGYIIGDTGRSFVVGYGTNPPQRPHHRASSCPPLGQACTWDYYNTPNPNPNTLYGALVGGPGPNDDYSDDRNDYIKNEVATDYNAGFTGAARVRRVQRGLPALLAARHAVRACMCCTCACDRQHPLPLPPPLPASPCPTTAHTRAYRRPGCRSARPAALQHQGGRHRGHSSVWQDGHPPTAGHHPAAHGVHRAGHADRRRWFVCVRRFVLRGVGCAFAPAREHPRRLCSCHVP